MKILSVLFRKWKLDVMRCDCLRATGGERNWLESSAVGPVDAGRPEPGSPVRACTALECTIPYTVMICSTAGRCRVAFIAS